MNRRSLLALLVLLGLACAGLFALLGRRGAEQAVEAEALAEPGAAPRADPIALAEAPAEERGRAQPFTPHTPERGPLAENAGRIAGWLRRRKTLPGATRAWRCSMAAAGGVPVLLRGGALRARRRLRARVRARGPRAARRLGARWLPAARRGCSRWRTAASSSSRTSSSSAAVAIRGHAAGPTRGRWRASRWSRSTSASCPWSS
jgi:hypothetical protein